MPDLGDVPRPAEAGRGDADLGPAERQPAGDQRSLGQRAADRERARGAGLVEVRVAHRGAVEADRQRHRPRIGEADAPVHRDPPAIGKAAAPGHLHGAAAEFGGELQPLDAEAELGVREPRIRQADAPAQGLQRRPAVQPQVEIHRPLDRPHPQDRVGDGGVRDPGDAQVGVRSVLRHAALDAGARAARGGDVEVEAESPARAPHRAAGLRRAGEARRQQRQVREPRIDRHARGQRPACGHGQLRVARRQPLDRQVVARPARGEVEARAAAQQRVDPVVADAEIAGLARGGDGEGPALLPDPAGGGQPALQVGPEKGEAGGVDPRLDVGHAAADAAGGAGVQPRVVDLGPLQRDGAALLGAGDLESGGAAQRRVELGLAEGEVGPGAGHGKAADAVPRLAKRALRRQRAVPAGAERRQRRHLDPRREVGRAGAVGAAGAGPRLRVREAGGFDREHAVAFGAGEGQRALPLQEAVELRLAEPDILCRASDGETPGAAAVVAEAALEIDRAVPAEAERRQRPHPGRAGQVGARAADGALRGHLDLVVPELASLDDEALGPLGRREGEAGGAGQGPVHLLPAEREVLAGAGQLEPPDALAHVAEGALGLERALPAAAERCERPDRQAAGQVGARLPDRSPGARRELVVGEVEPLQLDLPIGRVLRRLERESGGAAQRAVHVLLAEAQVLAGPGEAQPAQPVGLGDPAGRLDAAGPAGHEVAEIGERRRQPGVDLPRRQVALPLGGQLRVLQPQALQRVDALGLAHLHREVGGALHRPVERLDPGLQVHRLPVQGQPALPGGAAERRLGLKAAAHGRIDLGQRGQRQPRPQVARLAADDPLGVGRQPLAGDGQVAQLDPGLVAPGARRHHGVAAQEPVELLLPDGEVGGGEPGLGVEAPGQQDVIAAQMAVRLALHRPPGEAREPRELAVAGIDLARDGDAAAEAVDPQLALEAVEVAGDGEVGELDHVARGPVEAGVAGELRPDRLGQGRVGGRDPGGVEADRAGDLREALALEPNGALAVEIDAAERKAFAGEAVQMPAQGPARALGGVVAELQPPAPHRRRRAAERQAHGQLGRAGIGAERQQQHRAQRRVLGIGGERAREVQRLGVDQQHRHAEPAVVAAPALGQQLRLAAEEGALRLGDQCRHVAAEPQAEAAAGRAVLARRRGDGDLAGDPRLAVGRERDLGREIVERPLAGNLGPDRRAALEPDEIGEDAARLLVEGDVGLEDLGGVGIGGIDGEDAALAVHPLDRELGLAGAALEAHRAGEADDRGLAEHRLADLDPAGGDAVDLDRDRQRRQAEAADLGRPVALAGRRQARQADGLGRELGDLDPPREEGRAVPLDGAVVELDPDAVGIGDGDPLEGRARAQRPAEAVDLHLAPGAGQVLLEQAGQEPLVVTDLGREFGGALAVLRQGAAGGDGKGGGEREPQQGEKPGHQKACPRPR